MKTQRSASLIFRFVLMTCILASAGGCATLFNPVGENKYDCNRKENPDSPYCHSFRSVEQATSNDVPASRYDEKMSIAEIDKLTGIAPLNKQSGPSSSPLPAAYDLHETLGLTAVQRVGVPVSLTTTTALTPNILSEQDTNPALPAGTPVRIGPVVQRVWIKSFNDRNDMLTSDQVVYKEVVPTHWAGQASILTTQEITSGGLPGTYPHKPVELSTSVLNDYAVPSQTLRKDNSTSFNQPGSQFQVNETAPPLSDISDKSMPN